MIKYPYKNMENSLEKGWLPLESANFYKSFNCLFFSPYLISQPDVPTRVLPSMRYPGALMGPTEISQINCVVIAQFWS